MNKDEYMLLDSRLGEVFDCGVQGIADSGFSNYTIDICHINRLWKEGYTGQGAIVGVCDCGLSDVNHEMIKHSIIGGKNFSDDGLGEGDISSQHYHGLCTTSFISGLMMNRICYGVAPNAKVIIGKCMNNAGSGSLTSISQAIRYCVDSGANIVNLSVGSTYTSTELEEAVKYAVNNNVIVVASSGNDNKYEEDKTGVIREVRYPGAMKEVICVGAMDSNYNACGFSNSNDYLDIIAPGQDLVSAYKGNLYCTVSGTSFSAPIVSGIICLLREKFINERKRVPDESELFGMLSMYLRSIEGMSRTLQGNGYPDLSISRVKRIKK